MAVEFADGVVIGADSRTTTGYISIAISVNYNFFACINVWKYFFRKIQN